MKFVLLLFAAVCGIISAASAGETISVGANYGNDLFYHIEARAKSGEAPNANWDVGFETTGLTGSIIVNAAAGATLWATQLQGVAGFKQSIDTNALFATAPWYNSTESWHKGAFNMDKNAMAGDFGWGMYNPMTHVITGTTVYVIKLPDGSTRKVFMDGLNIDDFTFRYANIDGSGEQTKTFKRSDYATKNFVYFSMRTGQFLDREPASEDWHLVFGKYQTILTDQGNVPYVVTGVRANNGVKIAKYKGANPAGATDAGLTYSENITAIGHDWKTFGGTSYIIADDVAYFVKISGGDVFKIIFTSFAGGSTGNIGFTVEDAITSVEEETSGAELAVFPNPASGAATIAFDATGGTAEITLTDVIGRIVRTERYENAGGFAALDLSGLPQGAYTVTLTAGSIRLARPLMIR